MKISRRYTSPPKPPVLVVSKPGQPTPHVPILSLRAALMEGHAHPPLVSFGWARVALPGSAR